VRLGKTVQQQQRRQRPRLLVKAFGKACMDVRAAGGKDARFKGIRS
jgi:hypothetical protein